MRAQFMEKWDQYGLIAELALRLKGVSRQFGKTALQKLFYILQEVYRVPLGYDYTLYNYGPYSEELADDLVFLASMVTGSSKLTKQHILGIERENF